MISSGPVARFLPSDVLACAAGARRESLFARHPTHYIVCYGVGVAEGVAVGRGPHRPPDGCVPWMKYSIRSK
jgi:hypothetical protein